MNEDFIEQYKTNRRITDVNKLSKMDRQHYEFAASTRKRAIDALGIFEAYGFRMHGLRILDIGCAYGGFSIEAAKRGAFAYGIEIDRELYEYAVLNDKGEHYSSGECKFILTDATSEEFLEKLPQNFFDLIIVNDVFEHIYDTHRLLSNLSKVGNDKCSIYFVIPNNSYIPYIASEGHTGLCGLSIMPPLYWSALLGADYRSIYYHPFDYYKASFEYYGFRNIIPVNYPPAADVESVKAASRAEYDKVRKKIADSNSLFPVTYSEELQRNLKLFSRLLNKDLDHLPSAEIVWKYLTGFWAGFAHKGSLRLVPPIRTTQRRNSAENSDEVHFSLYRDKERLCVDVQCDFDTADYEFAYHLTMARQPKSLERSHYIKEMHYEWNLKAQGMYGAAIYVKYKGHEHKDFRILTQPLYYPGNKEKS